jgi:signal transduction histidine kinase
VNLPSASRLAAVLLGDLAQIVERTVARMQELLPAYATVPRQELIAVVLADTRQLLEAIRAAETDRDLAGSDDRVRARTRAGQGVSGDELLAGWRVGLDVVCEQAHARCGELGMGDRVLLEFVEATLRRADAGVRALVSAHRDVEIGELGRLADEQAALRRVATMVAREAPPEQVLTKVALEVGRISGAETAVIHRFDPDGKSTIVASYGSLQKSFWVGSRWKLEGNSVAAGVYRTGRPTRFDRYQSSAGTIAVSAHGLGIRSGVGSPIVVNGRLWGVVAAGTSRPEPLPVDAESRMAQFTELAATAIANVQARSDLAASRARIIATADDERRRVVRDLHDGAQQRLVSTIVTLKLARQALAHDQPDAPVLVGEALRHAQTATDELRELAHGILPTVLTSGGLDAAVGALASRMSIPVEVDVAVGRLPSEVEATAYFIVAETLTNVAKHSRARHAAISARLDDRQLRVEVRDDGVGGAHAGGSGLVGLSDRLAVLDGTLRIESPADGGTLVAASIPSAAISSGPG